MVKASRREGESIVVRATRTGKIIVVVVVVSVCELGCVHTYVYSMCAHFNRKSFSGQEIVGCVFPARVGGEIRGESRLSYRGFIYGRRERVNVYWGLADATAAAAAR